MEPRSTLQLASVLVLMLPAALAQAQGAAVDSSAPPVDDGRFLTNAFTAFELKPHENFRVIDSSSANAYCTPQLPECRHLAGDRRNRPDTLVRVKGYARRTSETASAMAARIPNDWHHLLLAQSDPPDQSALVKVKLRSWQGLPSVDALWMSPARTAPSISRFVFYPTGFRQQFECVNSMSDANWRIEDFEQQCDRGFGAVAFRQEFLPGQVASTEDRLVHDACELPEVRKARTQYAEVSTRMLRAAHAHVKALAIRDEMTWEMPETKRNEISGRLMDASEDSAVEIRLAAQAARDVKPVPVLLGLHRAIAQAAQYLNYSFVEFRKVTEGDFIADSQQAAQAAVDALALARQDANRCPVP
jgi:hypothetical protein